MLKLKILIKIEVLTLKYFLYDFFVFAEMSIGIVKYGIKWGENNGHKIFFERLFWKYNLN